MEILVTFLTLLVVIGAVGGPIVYTIMKKRFREAKEYERGLKMVPLLIHLPPPSDDIEGGGRDVRDVVDENISKATIIYNIIASTLQKGLKSKMYGQRHFAFEIIGTQGFVYFYAAVPVVLSDVVKQAVISAYPSARLEEAAEHNIFNKVGGIAATVGGELHLKNNFAFPIATYQDLKRDAMQSLLNALSTLEKEDGAGIQILLRPADPGWRKEASSLASNKRKDKDSKGGIAAVGGFMSTLGKALNGKLDEKGEKDKPKELSAMEQQLYDSIDEKTRHPGYEVLIRVVAASNVSGRAQSILNNVVAAFALFEAQGKNGFKFTSAKDIEALATSYIMRFFPHGKKKDILNSVELASVFHFPDQSNIPTSQLSRQASKQVDGPRNMPDDGLLLGYNLFRGAKKPIRLALGDRQRHMYAVGQTGTGKSTFLENLALQDMINGDGFAFIDPHGDTAEKLLSMVPKERAEDVIYFCPADMDYPIGLNLFEFDNPDQKDFLIQETLNMLQKLYDPTHQGIMGPRYEHIFRNAALAVMADPQGGTFVDIPKLFRDPGFLKQKLSHVTDQTVLDFWQKEYPQSQRSNDAGEVTAWFVSKFGAFLSNAMMRNIIGQTDSGFDLRDIMDNKKILLVNLSKGRTGDLNSKLLGMIFVMKFQAAAMSRANIPESQRQDFCLYVDEFQNFSTDSFATIMSEARKFHLNLIVANQFTTQLTQEIRDAVFGNMGTIVAFRVGQQDVEVLAKYFQPAFDEEDLLRVPNYNSIVRTLVGGVPTNPFSMSTLPPLGSPNPKLSEALKQLSSAKYGRPKGEVEKEIFARMSVTAPVGPAAFGAAPGAPGALGAGGAYGAPPAGDGRAIPGASPQVPPATAWGSAGITARPGAVANPRGFGAAPAGVPGAGAAAPYAAPASYSSAAPATGGFGAPGGAMGATVAPASAGVGYAPMPATAPGSIAAVAPPPANTSFLDDWLNKRSVAPSATAGPAAPAAAAGPVAPAEEPAKDLEGNEIPAYAGENKPAAPAPSLNANPDVNIKPRAGEAVKSTPANAAVVSKDEAAAEMAKEGVSIDGDQPQEITIDENGILQSQKQE